ncbi:MAG: nucleoside-diphosphate kinase [candidate division Zixibacteria bacterium]|nr:nucleoside-diphosphate kinase [candidate division Zixibacteria bacterium]NIR67817.1 nucleoside-diphosphate kinase [candidate division Zixibacteria bacterium]NIS15517.1 nucleoside-diphosphate kinase [candidate division Zixibacteria bacterium]NIS49042.1 nucleoside-diphosphate kinase [candidate division Zixibacteria bacterium]NIT52036.1 nucleoside-diphosphate kinase [candidate division Zixibacteria bacterium]
MANTLGIIKPDGVSRKLVGNVISRIERDGLILRGMKVLKLSSDQAQKFYAVHEGKPFYNSLVEFMTSGPIVVMVIGGHDSIDRWRNLMGATDPAKAKYNTIRREYGTSIERNVVHGSDSEVTAKTEVAFFFNDDEILPKGI